MTSLDRELLETVFRWLPALFGVWALLVYAASRGLPMLAQHLRLAHAGQAGAAADEARRQAQRLERLARLASPLGVAGVVVLGVAAAALKAVLR